MDYIYTVCTLLTDSVILCGLSLCGCVAVLEHVHFAIIPLLVEYLEEVSQTDLLQQQHPITALPSSSMSSLEQPVLSQMFVKANCIAR